MGTPRRGTHVRPLLALLLCLPAPPWAASRTFDFLYVNASEGSASGGHAAVRFDREVFHFQHVPPGLLRIAREDFAGFRHHYGYRENRSIRGHRIAVSEATYDWLKEAFTRRVLVQDEQFGQRDAIARDLWLVDAWRKSAAGLPSDNRPWVNMKALGYFRAAPWQPLADSPPAAPGATSLKALQELIASTHGEGFLAAKRRETWRRLQALAPEPRDAADLPPEETRFAPGRTSFSQRYITQLSNLAALDVLQQGLPLRPDSLRQPTIAEFKLTPGDMAALRAFRADLLGNLSRLPRSERADWGYPLLVGMARLQALDLSIASGQLAVLDRFDADRPSPYSDEPASGYRGALFQRARRAFTLAKSAAPGGQTLDERRYSQLEEIANAFLELRQGMVLGHPARLTVGGTTPGKPAPAYLPATTLSDTQLLAVRSALSARQTRYGEALIALYRYNLLQRNCVTELFRVINQAIAAPLNQEGRPPIRLAQLREEATRLLGGYVDEASLNLIPFVAFQTVGETYRVSSSYELPAYRDERMRRQARDVAPWLVDIQESNVLSSSVYRWHGDDAAFLFFTQDAVWPRPLLGSANLAIALGQSVTGLFTWPWDGGENLAKSLKGIAVSVPELFFFNIRKGSFPHAPPLTLGGEPAE